MIFYNNLASADGSVKHSGDNRTGAGDGDDESLTVDLSMVPADVDKMTPRAGASLSKIFDGSAK